MLAVLPAIAALRRRQQYVQVESILHEAANGPSGMSLNDHNILSYLSLLQHKIDSIITNYVGVNNIISIIDLEQELVHILNIFCFNSINYTIALINSNMKECESIVKDPNEIELDISDSNSGGDTTIKAACTILGYKKWESFIDFGLGCICKHPIIVRLYQLNIQCCVLCNSNSASPAFIPSTKIIEYVHNYYVNNCLTKRLHFDITAFTNKLCSDLKIAGLKNVGIIIKDNFFTNELVMLKLAIESKMHKKKIAMNIIDDRDISAALTVGVKRGVHDIDDHVHIRTHFESKIHRINCAKSSNIITIKTAILVNYAPAPLCFDLAAIDFNKAVGKWGESLVYQYLLSIAHLSQSKVQWMNEDVESKACYDLLVTTPIVKGSDIETATRYTTTYIEVKSTKYNDANVFELSLWEWEFAMANPKVPFHIYRVYNAGDAANVRVEIITDVQQMIIEGSIKLCLAIL